MFRIALKRNSGRKLFYFKNKGSSSLISFTAIPKSYETDEMPFIDLDTHDRDYYSSCSGNYCLDFDIANQTIGFVYTLGQKFGNKKFEFDNDGRPIFKDFNDLVRFNEIKDSFSADAHSRCLNLLSTRSNDSEFRFGFCYGWDLNRGDTIDSFKYDFVNKTLSNFGTAELREIAKELLEFVCDTFVNQVFY